MWGIAFTAVRCGRVDWRSCILRGSVLVVWRGFVYSWGRRKCMRRGEVWEVKGWTHPVEPVLRFWRGVEFVFLTGVLSCVHGWV